MATLSSVMPRALQRSVLAPARIGCPPMLSATLATVLAAAEHGAEPEKSKTAFYVAGGALAVWAVVISFVGITRPEFPEKPGPLRLVVAFTALLVAGAMGAAVATS